MRHPRKSLTHATARLLVLVLSLSCATIWLTGSAYMSGKARQTTLAQADTASVRQLTLPTNDLVYDKNTGKIYASVPSAAGSNGNSLTQINPITGDIGASVFIGSEPGKLALSDNGQYLYTYLEGAAALRRFDIAAQTAGLQFNIGGSTSSSISSSAFRANDIAVLPGSPESIAVARGSFSGGGGSSDVAIYDNGVQRPTTASNYSNQFIKFSASAAKLYSSTGNNSGLQRITVSASGASNAGATQISGYGDFRIDNGRAYLASGQVFDPETGSLFGTFPSISNTSGGSALIATESSANRAYFLLNGLSYPSSTSSYSVTLRAYDTSSFLQIGEVIVPGVVGTVSGFIRWGANGFAFRTSSNQVFLIQTSIVPSSEPVPAFSPTPAPSPTPTPTVSAFVRQVPLATKDLVFNPSTQTIYASVPSSAGVGGNSVTTINPTNGVVGSSVFVGSEPGKLALSDDNQYLYVGLDGAAAVRRFDTASQTPDIQFSLGNDQYNGPFGATDLAVLPGSPKSVAVARTAGGSSSYAVYDNGVKRGATSGLNYYNRGFIEFGASPSTLYTLTGTGVQLMPVSSSGVGQGTNKTVADAGGDFKIDKGLIYTNTGRTIDPEAGTLLGTFSLPPSGTFTTSPSFVVPDSAAGRVFFLTSANTDAVLRAFDINTFLPVGSLVIKGAGGALGGFVRWGENGFAFRSGVDQVFLVQTSLVTSSASVPTGSPTPAPSATPAPTPIPTPAPGELTQLTLTTKDLVFDRNTQTIYASVPGSAGAGGNSLTPINPTTGVAGTPVLIGSDPGKLAISDNGQYIYAALDGAAAVRRFDVASQTPNLQFNVGNSQSYGALGVEDMKVAPGNPNTVAISRLRKGVSPRHGGVAIYDNGIMRPTVTPDHTGSNVIEFSSSPSVLYGYNNESTEFGFRKMVVDTCGVAVFDVTAGLFNRFGITLKFDNGLIYGNNGRVIDPEAGTLAGTFSGVDSYGFYNPLVIPDSTTGRVYFLTSSSSNTAILRAFDLRTFLPVGALTIPNITGTPGSLIRWGTNGLAFRTESKVYILQTSLIPAASTPVPAPSPAVSAYTISGRATDFNNNPIGGATVTLSGAQNATTQTDANGYYSLGNLSFCGSYTVTATKSNYIFQPPVTVTPSSNSFNISKGNIQISFSGSPAPKSFQFGASSYSVNEGAGRAIITVTRSGDTSTESTVDYATSNGSAQDRTDYMSASGTLRFAPGDVSKTFDVLITDDAYVENAETVFLSLRNPTGGTFVNSSTVVLTILDNDTAQPNANPIDVAQFFVRQHYLDFLGRDADPGGLDYWTNLIANCPKDDAQCINTRRVSVSAAFFIEQEFQDTGSFVYRFYKASYGSKPTYAQFIFDRSRVVGGANLEAGKQEFAVNWVQRFEFLQKYPGNLTGAQFIDALLTTVKQGSGVDLSSQRNAFIEDYNANQSRARIVRLIADAANFKAAEYNKAFVLMQYFGYLRRDPDQGGYDFWLDVLNNKVANNYRGMVCAFATSREYQERFSPVVTRNDQICGQIGQ